jgi:hypothetical protein
LTGEYDALVTSLGNAARACGAALAGSAPISFSADQWTKVKGGNVDITVLASVHSIELDVPGDAPCRGRLPVSCRNRQVDILLELTDR